MTVYEILDGLRSIGAMPVIALGLIISGVLVAVKFVIWFIGGAE